SAHVSICSSVQANSQPENCFPNSSLKFLLPVFIRRCSNLNEPFELTSQNRLRTPMWRFAGLHDAIPWIGIPGSNAGADWRHAWAYSSLVGLKLGSCVWKSTI